MIYGLSGIAKLIGAYYRAVRSGRLQQAGVTDTCFVSPLGFVYEAVIYTTIPVSLVPTHTFYIDHPHKGVALRHIATLPARAAMERVA